MEKENQRVALTKRLLQEGLLRLLSRKELDKINITELCAEAGINRVTFYRHYACPHEILMEIERDLLEELKRSVKAPRSRQDVKQYLNEICAFLCRHTDLLKTVIRANTDKDFYTLFNEILQELWQGGAFGGILDGLTPDERNILGIYCSGGAYFVLRQWLLGNIQKTPQEIVDITYKMLCSVESAGITRLPEFTT